MKLFHRRKKPQIIPISSVIANAIIMRAEKQKGQLKIINLSHLQGYTLGSKLAL